MMKKATIYCVLAVCVVALSSIVLAEGDHYEGREQITIDHEALKSMSWEERRAYMQTYKDARAAEARRAGVVPGDGEFHRSDTPRTVNEPKAGKVMGNITYDSGTVSGTAGLASQMLGNRFDSALNTAGTMCCFPVENSGSITMITFDMVNTFFSSAVFSIYSNIMGTTAAQVTSMGRGVMTGLNTLSVMSPTTANAYNNGAFIAGLFQFNPVSTGLAVDTGTVGGQGFHAVSINDGTTGVALTSVTTGGGGGLNAVFRVSGNLPTPVELINFTIVN